MDFDLDEWNNIGNILVRRGSLTKKELNSILVEQNRRSGEMFGELAIEMGLIDADILESALHEQKIHRIPQQSSNSIEARKILAIAFASVSKEVDRMSERRARKTGIVLFEMSPTK